MDITQRKNAELEVKASEEKFRHLFENSPYAIYLTDVEGKILDYNSATEEMFFKDRDKDVIGKRLLQVMPKLLKVSPELVSLYKQRIKKLANGIPTEPLELELEFHNGKKVWIHLISTLLKLEDKNIFQVMIQDITSKKQVQLKLKESEEDLRVLNKELEEKVIKRTKKLRESENKLKQQNIELKKIDKIKNDFITMAAHELKTPLISIYGYTDYILTKHDKDLNQEIKDDLHIVQRNIIRLRNYMNQLLDVMKIDEDKLKLNKESLNVCEVIDNCINELSYQFKEKEHELILNCEREILLNVDAERIFQVFSNLLSNAIKFTPNNGRIEIKGQKEVNEFIFRIIDNGIGLSEQELEKIFNKFEMGKQLEDDTLVKEKGTGLGLYISKGIIEAHGGRIQASSEGRNKGTTFTFTLPF